MKQILFGMLAAGFLAVSANAACDQIASASDLITFASKVNGGEASACAELTADIYFNGDSKTAVMSCLNDDKSGLKDGCNLNEWVGIGSESVAFEGSIDGKNHTIYGLYVNEDYYPAFVRRAVKSASIKNLAIEDSYFRVTGWDGGAFIGDVVGDKSTNDVRIENCSFKGVVYAASGSTKVGGLVGGVSRLEYKEKGTLGIGEQTKYAIPTLTISNSYNAGEVLGSGSNVGALVGYVDNGVTLTIENSYNIGTAIAVVGASDASAGTITFNNVSCVGTNCGVLYKEGSTTNKVTTKGTGVNVASSEAEVLDKVVDGMSTNADALNAFFEKNGSGVSFEEITLPNNEKGIKAWLKPTKTGSSVDFSENDNLIIPADVSVDVDEITFNREFKFNVLSTVMFPFSVKASDVTNANFFAFAGVTKTVDEETGKYTWVVNFAPLCGGGNANGYDVVNCSDVDVLVANQPYIVKKVTGDEGPLTFKSAKDRGYTKLTIVKTVGSLLNVQKDLWILQGVYEYKVWQGGEVGDIYGFAASKTISGYEPGAFLKAKAGSTTKAMRAYLVYNRPASPKPSALMKTSVSEELPSEMPYRIIEYVAPEKIVETIPVQPVDPGADPEDSDEVTEAPLGFAKAEKMIHVIKNVRWYDVNGRNMKCRPNSQGAFIKNGMPVVVK